jgi:acetyl esterase/lipase
VYVPDAKAFPGPRPVIVFFYGGAWQRGERGDHKFVGQTFASKGFVVVVPDYRVYPEVKYPEFVRDAAAAFAWTRREIPRYAGNSAHLVLMGHSAGAHIAAMLTYNERFLKEVGLAPSAVHALVGLAGPYDFEPSEPEITALMSGEGETARAMPARYVGPGAPPALLLQGDADTRVEPANLERLVARLKAAGDSYEARFLPGLSHATILVGLSKPLRNAPLVDEIAAFAAR